MVYRINALLAMCKDISFDEKKAEELVRGIDLNIPISDPEYPKCNTTFLNEAVNYDNFRMAELFLRHGADPNFILYKEKKYYEENIFWDLQYDDGEDDEANEQRLKLAQLMLEYGADPQINVDNTEDLFSYVRDKIFEDRGEPSWEYLSRFFILLIAYGGGTKTYKPPIYRDFDKSNMKQYTFINRATDDGLLFGQIIDKNGIVVAEV